MPLPNWPGADPATPNPNPTGDPAFVVNTVLHSTIQEAKAAGAVEGTMLAAPLAPSTGPINAPAESMVVVAVKKFKDSPTYKAIRAVVLSAVAVVGITFGNAILNVWSSGKSVFDAGAIDWRATERVAEIAAGPVLIAGLMALMKKKDNNPVQ
jgi:hypothetical protein